MNKKRKMTKQEFDFDNALTVEQTYREIYLPFPKVFLSSNKYKDLSDSAKICYMVLKQRAEMSVMNNWVDENGYVYFIFDKQDLANILGKSRPTATRYVQELENYGLIYQKNMGFDKGEMKQKPNRIYIANLSLDKSDYYDLRDYDNKVEKTFKDGRTKDVKESAANVDTNERKETEHTDMNERSKMDAVSDGSKTSANLDMNERKETEHTENNESSDTLQELNNRLNKDIKDIKESKGNYDHENDFFENGLNSLKDDHEENSKLIQHAIEENSLETLYGKYIVENMVKYSFGSFETFDLYINKLIIAHKQVEEEENFGFCLDPIFTPYYESYQKELSTTFYKVIQQQRQGRVKSFNNYLFISLKSSLSYMAKQIKKDRANRNTASDSEFVKIVNYKYE